jgi:hypothetical protein
MDVHYNGSMSRVQPVTESFEKRGIRVPKLAREDIITIICINEYHVIRITGVKNKVLSICLIEAKPLMDAFPQHFIHGIRLWQGTLT